jgi:hypothetical protein
MAQPIPPAVYRCIIPVERPLSNPSAIYHSLFRRKERLPFFPAWPEIDDPNCPCCLPTLCGAEYYIYRGSNVPLDITILRAEAYLAQQESLEPEIREQALTFIKSQVSKWRFIPEELRRHPEIFCAARHTKPDRESAEQPSMAWEILEAVMQALIYGNYSEKMKSSNFMGPKEAFGFAHESAHRIARRFSGGDSQNTWAWKADYILFTLTEGKRSRGKLVANQ